MTAFFITLLNHYHNCINKLVKNKIICIYLVTIPKKFCMKLFTAPKEAIF